MRWVECGMRQLLPVRRRILRGSVAGWRAEYSNPDSEKGCLPTCGMTCWQLSFPNPKVKCVFKDGTHTSGLGIILLSMLEGLIYSAMSHTQGLHVNANSLSPALISNASTMGSSLSPSDWKGIISQSAIRDSLWHILQWRFSVKKLRRLAFCFLYYPITQATAHEKSIKNDRETWR